MATLLQPCRLAVHSLLERLVGFLRGLKFYMVRVALHVELPVCSSDSNGRTSGVYRKTDLRQIATFSLILRQIRLRSARPSVRVRAADWQHYSGHDAAAVVFQSAQEYDEAFEQGMYRKSALLQQRRRTGG